MAKGTISVNSENLFPIIKKWLYSDKDIFLRELISNACDAVTKLKKLSGIGVANIVDDTDYKVQVICDKENKKLIIEDNGIGMTSEEIDKYITQIAFSGASDFLENYKDDKNEDGQIIGHFGLGFYSAFMVASRVEIDSLSYQDGAVAAKWSCDGGMDYDLSDGSRQSRGTTITLHISEDSEEFLEEFTVRSVMRKYCAFLPVPVYLDVVGKDEENQVPINDTHPLWMKQPKDCTDEEYKEFYKTVFGDFNDPLFWIHLNVDFPFNLKGILYFPKLNHEFGANEGQIKLFNNQVFVADNVKEVIPEFLMLLKGVIDCPDLPLNVSRSFLQNDGYVKKISSHITKKIADKLNEINKKQPDEYHSYWDDINIFIKYGCMRDEKFYEKVSDILLYKDINDNYLTLSEYFENRDNKDVYYVSDPQQQAQYISLLKEQGLNAVMLPAVMDTHFISFIETKQPDVKFKRIDSALAEDLQNETENSDEDETLTTIFKDILNMETLKIEVQSLKKEEIPAILLLSEESRRMQEMYRSFGQQMASMANMFKDEFTLVLNRSNPLVKKIAQISGDDQKLVCSHIYDLAMISHKPLDADQMSAFILRNTQILERLF